MEKDTFQCAIEGRVTAALANELREAILPMIDGSQTIEIDLSEVSDIDYAGVLLLVEVKLEANARGKALRFVSYSRPVLDILAVCNMGRFLDAPALSDTVLQ